MTSATDNRTTELLRKLLDERGLSCQTHYLHVSWRVGSKLYDAVDNLDGTLTVDNLTPEQAVAATLGGGTCEFVSSKGSDYPPVCSACGYELGIYDCEWFEDGTYGYERNYCPNCGCKVVSE